MALTPGLYVPQGQVGTGAAYVHEIKDRSNYLEAIAKSAERKRVDQEKQMAKLKGFDYGKVVDQKMKDHISKKYKEGLEKYAKIVAYGGDISSTSTEEGIDYSTWQNQIKDEADTAAIAEQKKEAFLLDYKNHPNLYDSDVASAVLQEYEEAETPDDKLRATQNIDPIHLKEFDYNKWIQEEIDNAKTDKEITKLGKETTEYQNVYNKKLEEIPAILATKPGYRIAEKQWLKRKENGEAGFDQPDFATFLTAQVDAQKDIREFQTESPAAKPNITNVSVNTGGSEPTTGVVQPLTQGSAGFQINFPDLETAFQVDGKKAGNELAFWVAGSGRVPNLVLRKGSSNPADYGLDSKVAAENPQDNNAIIVKGSNLWQFRTADPPIAMQPGDVAKLVAVYKGKTFTDENGNATGGTPSLMYKDQLGNLWLDLADENSSQRHVLLETGKLTGTYVNAQGTTATNPLAVIAEQNRLALAAALGVSWEAYKEKYLKNNLYR